jgi:hypothetical protein
MVPYRSKSLSTSICREELDYTVNRYKWGGAMRIKCSGSAREYALEFFIMFLFPILSEILRNIAPHGNGDDRSLRKRPMAALLLTPGTWAGDFASHSFGWFALFMFWDCRRGNPTKPEAAIAWEEQMSGHDFRTTRTYVPVVIVKGALLREKREGATSFHFRFLDYQFEIPVGGLLREPLSPVTKVYLGRPPLRYSF